MSIRELEKLVEIRQLKREQATREEFTGLLNSARKRLADARNTSLAPESRFDLAYGAAHGFALAALRQKGYRSENRFTVFQALVHTTNGLDRAAVQIFARCHNERNLAEYEGRTEIDERLLEDLIRCTADLEKLVLALDPPVK